MAKRTIYLTTRRGLGYRASLTPPVEGERSIPFETENGFGWEVGAQIQGGGVVPASFSATTANGEPMTYQGAQIFDDGKYLYLRAA